MSLLARSSFLRGWVPNADAVNGPPDALLRMDNCVLDELGAVSLRAGASRINSSPLADTDVHSLYTAVLNGTRYRMAGAANAMYANGSSIASGLAGSGDVALNSWLGHIVFARGTSKKKYDGTTVRNWGIAAPGAAPTLSAVAADSKTFATCALADAEFVMNEDDGTGVGYRAGYDGAANEALVIRPATTGRGTATKTFGGVTDFSSYSGGQVATDDDLIDFYLFATEPQYIQSLVLSVDVNDGLFQQDVYTYRWDNGVRTPVSLDEDAFLSSDYSTDGFARRDAIARREQRPGLSAGLRPDKLSAGAWTHFQIPRGAMIRTAGLTSGKNWSTVKAVRFTVIGTSSGSGAAVAIDNIQILGGAQRPLTGKYKGIVVGVYNSGTYQGKSAVSATSAEIELKGQALRLTVDATTITNLDSQVNELWAFVMGGDLDGFYRGAVKTGGPFVGAQTIDVTMSDRDMLIANIRLERTNTAPPNGIVGIAGPHYDRLLCLTATTLCPSRPLTLDSFDSLQAVTVGDSSETAYWIAKVREEIYVGTSKDIYRLSGDWTARPDLSLNVLKQALGVSHPPISAAVAQSDDSLLYLASDGWRQLGAAGPLAGPDIDLLYRGQTRHGVSPVNLSTGRFRAAFANGLLNAITPEGGSAASSAVLHRYRPSLGCWYRHTWVTPAWRAIHREPDGTLIASDTSGYVWQLDTGTQDNGANIPVVLWTKADDDGRPAVLKTASTHRATIDTGGATASVALHADRSDTAATTLLVASSSAVPVQSNAEAMSPSATHIQQRITGSFATFRLYGLELEYVDEPPKRRRWDSGALDLGQRRTWAREVHLNVSASADLAVTVTCDGLVTSTRTVTALGTAAQVYRVPLGRADHGTVLRIAVESAGDFQFYWADVLRRVSGTASDNRPIRVAA